ncbi:MAG: exonuclease sbcCD subunit D [Legionellales bacterium]|nr:exonuclease sbcCD subunit D [Legionellales bacterium]|tara:strand:+ start:1050 stop:2288 length:1239 start_codon:yes stop_codon:yes gene_type:complete
MKLLHTSDWHLGRTLYGKKRYDEFIGFLDWLVETITKEQIDILLIAGDIFDTSTPSNRAQALYYQFLCKVSTSCCRHVVVIGGNHDSPSFLNAPKELLKALNVHVVGAITDNLEDEVIILHQNDEPEAIICAIPYLRDKDIRKVEAGESIDDKNTKLIEGVKSHYQAVCAIAEQKQKALKKLGFNHTPIIAMGHLFAAGGKTVTGDGVRELYVGSLAHVRGNIFPDCIDYLALGHLHVPQIVGGAEHIRYSGSPIPMGYGEAKQTKKVLTVTFNKNSPTITEINIPCFQPLARIVGSFDQIIGQVKQLKDHDSNAWLEIEYTGCDAIGSLRETLEELLIATKIEIRRIKNKQVMDRVMNMITEDETLDDINENDVFIRCLDENEIPANERDDLMACYHEIIQDINEQDKNAQ